MNAKKAKRLRAQARRLSAGAPELAYTKRVITKRYRKGERTYEAAFCTRDIYRALKRGATPDAIATDLQAFKERAA